MKSYESLLPPLLEAGVSLLVYAGRNDPVCNVLGQRVSGRQSLSLTSAGPLRPAATDWRAGALRWA